MKQLYSYWLPDNESHFSKFIERNARAGCPPEYQEPVRTRALGYVKNKNISIDIGANFGLWSQSLEKAFIKNFAIEPIDLHCEYLKLNAPHTVIHQTALGEKEGTITMKRDTDNYGKTRVDSSGETIVPIKRLDDLNLPTADFIKIDVEGFEYNVLLGGEQYIKTSYPVLVVEQEDKNNPATELLHSWGYQVVDSVKHDYIYKKI